MGIFDPEEVINEYSIKQAVEDGALVEVLKNEWRQLSSGKPIVASANVYELEGEDAVVEIWNRFVFWRKYVCPKLPENQRRFSTEIGVSSVWVIDYKVCFAILYLEDY
jgi:hypothetical protein